MKTTIITLLALAGVAAGNVESISTYYTTIAGQITAYGFILSPSDAFMTYSGGTLGATFDLDSVTLQCSAKTGSHDSIAKLAIFERQGSDSIGKFVALSNATTHTCSGNTTYDFADVITLTSSNQYQFFWVKSDTSADVFSKTEGNQNTYATYAATSVFDKVYVAAAVNSNMFLPTGDGIVKDTGYTQWDGHNMAMVTLNLVPEPTTATLSLLALAGLAARRRRR